MQRTVLTTCLSVLLAGSLYAGDTCDKCGDDSGKLTELTLENDMGKDTHITVFDEDGNLLIDEMVDDGDTFSFDGQYDNDALGDEVYICISDEYYTTLQTGCSHVHVEETIDDFTVKALKTTPCEGEGGGKSPYDEGWDAGYDPGAAEAQEDVCSGGAYHIDEDFSDESAYDQGWAAGYKYGYDESYKSGCQNPEPSPQPNPGNMKNLTLKNTISTGGGTFKVIDANGNLVLEEHVGKNKTFTIENLDDTEHLGDHVTIYYRGKKWVEIPTGCTSCENLDDEYNGLEVVDAECTVSCHVPPAPQPEPNPGNMSNLTLTNTIHSGTITVLDANGNIVFKDYVKKNDDFTIEGLDDTEHLGDYIVIKLSGETITEIPTGCTSCENLEDAYNGLEVVDAECTVSCHVPPAPQPEPNPGNMTSLTLKNVTGDGGTITVIDGNGDVVYRDYVDEDETFTIEGIDNQKLLGDHITIKMHGRKIATIPTGCQSCKELEDNYNGLEVVDAECTVNCEIAPPANCTICQGGVTSLTFKNIGDAPSHIVLGGGKGKGKSGKSGKKGKKGKSGKSGKSGTNIDEYVAPGDTVTIGNGCGYNGNNNPNGGYYQWDDNGKSGKSGKSGKHGKPGKHGKSGKSGKKGKSPWGGNSLSIVIDGTSYSLHTSCSKPIGVGMKFDNFVIVGGCSKNGPLCNVDDYQKAGPGPHGPGGKHRKKGHKHGKHKGGKSGKSGK